MPRKSPLRVSGKHRNPLYVPRVFKLDSLDDCREAIARALWSYMEGEMEREACAMVVQAAEKASKTLMGQGAKSGAGSKALQELAKAQPSEIPDTARMSEDNEVPVAAVLHDDGDIPNFS